MSVFMMNRSGDGRVTDRHGKRDDRTMRAGTVVGLLALAVLCMPARGAAQDQARKIREAFPPDVAEQIEQVVRSARETGVPAGPLYDKALEGAAKRVPPARVLPAVRAFAERMHAARNALGTTREPWIVAGADALGRGVSADILAQVGQGDDGRGPMSLVVLGDLVESGVPANRAVEVVREALRSNQAEADIAAISGAVDRMIRNGDAPSDVVRRLVRHMRRGLPVRQIRDVRGNLLYDRPGPPVAPGVETVDKVPSGGA